jgi:HEAT repeat protein
MTRRTVVLLLVASAAVADRGADLAVANAIREFNFILIGRSSGSIESVRDRIIANIGDCSPRYAKSIRRQLDRAFTYKVKHDDHFYKCTAEALAGCGEPGIKMLYKRYKSSKKRGQLRISIAEALGGCGNEEALTPLLKVIHDPMPEVAAAAVTGCGPYAKVKPDTRKKAMRELIDRYKKVTDDAAGKPADSREMHMYAKVKSAMDATLKLFSGGEELDSALAWDAWLRDNVTKPWPK